MILSYVLYIYSHIYLYIYSYIHIHTCVFIAHAHTFVKRSRWDHDPCLSRDFRRCFRRQGLSRLRWLFCKGSSFGTQLSATELELS